jgi:hypothetical protein
LDARSNNGGSAIVPVKIAEFFGDLDRVVFEDTWYSHTDGGGSEPLDLKTLLFATGRLQASIDAARVSPSTTASLYPLSVWQNAEFVFMTDTRAGSGGDVFPNCFLGDVSQTGNLGGGIQTHMLGSVDGRLTGYALSFDLPYSKDSPRVRDSLGNARTPFHTTSDGGSGVRRIDGTYFANRVPGLEIDYSGVHGLAGGNPLWADWDELVYKGEKDFCLNVVFSMSIFKTLTFTFTKKDLGFVPNNRPVLGGWPGPQTPTVTQGAFISVTAGSNVVTIQTPGPHGFNTGDDIALASYAYTLIPSLGGLPSRVFTGGHIITVLDPTTFTFETSDEGTNYEGPEFIGSIPVGLGTGSIGPSTTFFSPTAAFSDSITFSFPLMRRNDWRDAWLEQAITTIILAKKKRSANVTESAAGRKRTTHQERRAAKIAQRALSSKFDLEKANKLHGRNVGCPSGMNLTNPRTMPSTINITFDMSKSHAEDSDGRAHALEAARVRTLTTDIIKQELRAGGMCLDSLGRLMATPTCRQNPHVLFQEKKPAINPCVGKKKKKTVAKKALTQRKKNKTRSISFEPLPEGTTYESCMLVCTTSFTNTTKDHRMCILKCKALFPAHVFHHPGVSPTLYQNLTGTNATDAKKRAREKASKETRC